MTKIKQLKAKTSDDMTKIKAERNDLYIEKYIK